MAAVAGDLHCFSGVFTVLAAIFASRLAVTIASRMSTFVLLPVRHIHPAGSERLPKAAPEAIPCKKLPANRCRPKITEQGETHSVHHFAGLASNSCLLSPLASYIAMSFPEESSEPRG